MTDGQKLKEIRRVISEHKKCTQADFAKMIGTTTSMVGKMEAGIKPVTDNFKRRIDEALGVEILDEYEWPVFYTDEGYKRYKVDHYFEVKLEQFRILGIENQFKLLYMSAKTRGPDELTKLTESFWKWSNSELERIESLPPKDDPKQ